MHLRTDIPQVLFKRTRHRSKRHTRTRRQRRTRLMITHPRTSPRYWIVQAAGPGKEDLKVLQQSSDKENTNAELGYPARFLRRILYHKTQFSNLVPQTITL